MTDLVACLHVCITCRAGLKLEPGGVPMGADLHRAMAGVLGDGALREGAGSVALREGAGRVALRTVECLAVCERGCTAAISMPGKWSYLLGGLRPEMAADLAAYAQAYVRSASGTIMPSRRASSLKDMIVGRIPGFDAGARGPAA